MAKPNEKKWRSPREVKVMGKVPRYLTPKLEYVIIDIKELKMSTIP